MRFGVWITVASHAKYCNVKIQPPRTYCTVIKEEPFLARGGRYEEMDDGRIGQSERRTVIQFTIWPSIYLGDITSAIAPSLSLSLSLSRIPLLRS